MKKSMLRFSSQNITILIAILTVILSLVFGAGSSFIQKNSENNMAVWKYPYVYYYEEWKDIPINLLACDFGGNPNLYEEKVEELKQKEPQPPDETDPNFEKKMEIYQEKMEMYVAQKQNLDNAYAISQSIPTSNYNAVWYATLLPTLFGTEIVTFFFVAEIILIFFLSIKSRCGDSAKREQLAVKTAVASYLIYTFSFLTLYMIYRTINMKANMTLLFSPVTIIGFILGAVCIGALFLKKRLTMGKQYIQGKSNGSMARTLLLSVQILLFIAISSLALLPVFNYSPNGKIGFLETFILTSLEQKYDSLEMFLALAGFVSTVSLIGICMKGIYNAIYYLYFGKNIYGGQKADMFQNFFAIILSALISLISYAIKAVIDQAAFLAPSVTFDANITVEILPPILLLLSSAILLSIPFIIKAIGKKNADTVDSF